MSYNVRSALLAFALRDPRFGRFAGRLPDDVLEIAAETLVELQCRQVTKVMNRKFALHNRFLIFVPSQPPLLGTELQSRASNSSPRHFIFHNYIGSPLPN